MSEIEEALDVIASQDNKNVILLHCVSVILQIQEM